MMQHYKSSQNHPNRKLGFRFDKYNKRNKNIFQKCKYLAPLNEITYSTNEIKTSGTARIQEFFIKNKTKELSQMIIGLGGNAL